MIPHVGTFTLLLDELVTGKARAAVIKGNDAVLNASGLAAFFAGCTKDVFAGGVFLITAELNRLESSLMAILTEKGTTGRKLLILDDCNSPSNYSLNINATFGRWPEVSLILVCRHPECVTGEDFTVNLTDAHLPEAPLVMQLAPMHDY